MFEISVESDFDAAHYLRGYQGKCETLHGHRFKVVATVRADALNDIGLGYDFTVLKKKLNEVLSRYDHTCLNDNPPFDKLNPSSENIAVDIYTALHHELGHHSAAIRSVEVWESPQSHVLYRPD